MNKDFELPFQQESRRKGTATRLKRLWLFIFLLFLFAFIYLWEHSTTVVLTFRAHEEDKKLRELTEKVETLRVKVVALSSAQRIYRIIGGFN